MIRYLTAGESHGKALVAIIDGLPAGLRVDVARINKDLERRQQGYGRGRRMQIEKDQVHVLSGLRSKRTIGSPIALQIKNKDASIDELPLISNPRPGHADLAGGMKYNFRDFRDVLERASARETAARVAAGALCKILLKEFEIDIFSHVLCIGDVKASLKKLSYGEIRQLIAESEVRCADTKASADMMKAIDEAAEKKDSLGGTFEVVAIGLPPGLGTYVQWDRRLDARLAKAMISIPAVKGVEFGMGFSAAERFGSQVHDEILYNKERGIYRKSNNAGGLEGGVSTGEPLVVRAAMKPIATLVKPLESIDIGTKEAAKASVERADTCAVPAAGVIGEAVCAVEIAEAFLEKFGGDSIDEIKRNYHGYLEQVKKY